MAKKNSRAIPEKIEEARTKIISELPLGKYLMDKKHILSDYHSEGKMVCPVHDDRNPSCFYNLDKGVYNCFSCGSKGSVVELDLGIHKREDEKENLVKTIIRLSKEYNIQIPNMFEFDIQTQKVRRNPRAERANRVQITLDKDSVALRKIERLENLVKQSSLTPKEKLVFFHNCDRALLGEVPPVEALDKLQTFLNGKKG